MKENMIPPELKLKSFEKAYLESLQKDRCAICRKKVEKEKRRMSVDHCHKTGRIRGLLCLRCNTGLGMFKDNVKSLRRAIIYFEREYDVKEALQGKNRAIDTEKFEPVVLKPVPPIKHPNEKRLELRKDFAMNGTPRGILAKKYDIPEEDISDIISDIIVARAKTSIFK